MSKRTHLSWWALAAAAPIFAAFLWFIAKEQTAVEELRQQNTAVVNALERGGAAVLLIDDAGAMTLASASVEHLTGYPVAELIGESMEMLIASSVDAESHRAGFRSSMTGGEAVQRQVVCTIRRKDGETIVVLNRVFIFPGGGISILTPAHGAQLTAFISELGIATEGVGVWWWDLETGQLAWDADMFRIYGVTGEEQPNIDDFLAMVHPDDRTELNEQLADCIENGTQFTGPFRIIRPSGEVVQIRAHGQVFDVDGFRMFTGINIEVERSY
jgi:PAS domain S-box-containing protein